MESTEGIQLDFYAFTQALNLVQVCHPVGTIIMCIYYITLVEYRSTKTILPTWIKN